MENACPVETMKAVADRVKAGGGHPAEKSVSEGAAHMNRQRESVHQVYRRSAGCRRMRRERSMICAKRRQNKADGNGFWDGARSGLLQRFCGTGLCKSDPIHGGLWLWFRPRPRVLQHALYKRNTRTGARLKFCRHGNRSSRI